MKKPLLFTLLLFLVAFAWADVYPIGTLGTSSSSTYGPFNGYYDFGWTKTIVTAAEMTAAGYDGTDNMVGVGYYVGNTPSNYEMLDLHMFIRHTTLTTYTTTADETGTAMPDSTAFTQVFSGNLTFNGGGWFYIAFNLANFDWDGTSNIEIFWKNWDGDYVTGYPTWRYSSTSPDYKLVYKQADTTWPTTAGTGSTSRSNLALVTPQTDPPNPAVLVYPANAGYCFLDGVLSWSDGGGMPDGYDVYLDTVDGSTLVSNDQPGTSYTPTLAPGTTYYWKVVPYNANGPATGVTTWSFKTPTADQIAESFDATEFPPLGWTTPGGAFTRNTTTPYYGAASAYEYIAAGPSYLHTSMLELTATSELDWWMRTSATTGIGRVQIVYSEDGTTWNNIGDEIVMPTETTWMNYNVDLSSLAGNNYMIGFKVYSSTSTSTYFYIDHVVGPELAALVPEPATLVYPADAGYAFLDGTLQWNPAASGGIPSSYDVYFGTTNPPDYVTNQAELTYTPTLAAATTYYWQIVPRNGTGPAVNCPVWSFATPGATQLAESFDDTSFPPLGWLRTTTSTSYWGRSTSSPFYGAASMYAYTSTSTAYTISTPILAVDATSSLDFYAKASATSQVLQVLQSTDRTTWTQVGADITFAATGIWYPVTIDLSGLTPGNYYLAFHSPQQTAASSIYVDHLFGPDLAAVAPGAPTLTAPADLATDVSEYTTFSWTAPTTGGIPTGYNLYLDTASGSTLYASDVTSPYTLTTALNYNTLYYWTVAAYNGSGTGPGATVRSFTTRPDPIIYTMPWLEDFGTTGTTFPPTNWTRWSGLLTDPVSLTENTSSTYWYYEDWLNTITDPVNYSACFEIWSTGRNHWLMSPPIQMPGAGYQLEFDLALTDWNNANPIEDPLNGLDDRFAVLIGDGVNWSTANAVKVWDNDDLTSGDIYEVYNSVSHTGEHWILPLDSYTGIKYIAFYGESTVSNADNDFFVDNVMIRLTPAGAPEHVTLVAPVDGATGVYAESTTLTWTPALTGGTPAYYEIYVGADPIDPGIGYYGEYFYESETASLDLSAQSDIDLAYNSTWYWAVLPYNSDGLAPDPDNPEFMVWDFTIIEDPTIVALPHYEYFDSVTAPALPYGWTSVVEATTTYAVVATYSSTTYAVTPPNSARLYNSTDIAANLLLITPDFSMPLNTMKVRFYARSSTAGEDLYIGAYNPTTQVFTQIGAVMDLTTTQTQYTVPLSAYLGADTFLAFKHGVGTSSRTIYIDNVEFIEMLAIDLAATTITGSNILEAGVSSDFVVTAYNEGTTTINPYEVQLKRIGDDMYASVTVTEDLAPGATAQITIPWTPATGGVYQLYGKVVATGDGNAANDETPLKEVYVLDNTMTVISLGDDATTTSSTMLPVDMYYRNSVTEELYFTDEMHLQSGTITALVYKNTFLNERPDKAIKIWLAHTTVTDLSGGWLPALDYTLVFDGTVDFPSGVNYVVIPLDTPFAYTGGTLATRFYRVFDSGALSSSDKFYYTTNPAHTVRSRYLRNDSTTYDPLAPSAAGTTLGYFPNTTFVVQNAVMQAGAVLNGYVYEAGGTTPVAGATVTLTDERYSATTDATGFYEFTFWEAHTVDAAVAKFGYYGATQASISLPLGTPVTQDFYLTPLPQASVSGTVTANDYPAGLEGATVSLFGYDDYEVQTGTGGAFSIADVYGNSAGEIYSVTVEKDGYTSYIGTLTVYESAVTGLSYNLVEYLWTPYNLVASHEGADARLNWDPAGLPDYQFYDFEADNGGFTHVDNPTPGWEWGTSSYSGAHSGTKVWGTVLEGNYANSAVYDLISPPSNLIPAGAFLTFWHFYRFEFYTTPSYYDGGIVQISTDGGTNWTTITPVGGYPCTSTSGLGSIQMYGGEQLTWTQANFDLSAYTNQTVMFKWKMLSESSVSREGWFVDDVFIGIPIAKTALQRFGASNDDRVFLNYDVYRFLAADEGTPGNWTQLDDDWADVTFLDTGFAALGEGSYKWAVKANYSGALESEAIISNALGIFITPPDVENGTIGATGNNVTIAWPAEPGASYYTVYGSNDPYAPDPWAILGYSATPSFTFDAGATAYKFFKITASDGEMPASKGVWPQLNK